MKIKGQIVEIIYQNELNGYTVAELETKDETTTVVGYLPFIEKGDTLELEGTFTVHQDYGRQFKIETFEKIMPETLDALEKYLAGGVIKGVGPSTAKKIVNTFKEETIAVLRFSPEKLRTIKGITEQKANAISEEFVEKWELWQIVGFLEKFGINAEQCKKVYKIYGQNAIDEISKNPYGLLDIVYGVDFNKIDKMALDLGINIDDAKRIESAIKYGLRRASVNGNTMVLKENLIEFVQELIKAKEENIEEGIINLNARKEIVIEKEDTDWVYLNTFYICEKNIAEKLMALLHVKNSKKIKNFDSKFQKSEGKSDINLSNKQKEAINLVNENNVCVITGGPGTGKTTIIKFIIDLYKQEGKTVVLCAPTGRAAKRMTETTGEEASTIHRLLEIRKQDDTFNLDMLDYPVTPIDADVIIIDEMSMVDIFLMNYILRAIYLGTKLVLVGDANQLPSVGPGNVLKDILASKKIPVVELNEIFRQAAKSKIVTNAHRVNEGEGLLTKSDLDEEQIDDFFFINQPTQDKALAEVISLCSGRLNKIGEYEFFKDIQVLTPTKKGILGTKELNKALQLALNKEKGIEKTHGDRVFKIGDRVMQTRNNYDIFWEKDEEDGTGIFNGEMGRITKIEDNEKHLLITFDDGKKAWYEYGELDQIEHAYSLTIHKSQRKRI